MVTVPGRAGFLAAFLGEGAIAFVQMFLVLSVSNTPRLARFTGLFAGLMLAAYIAVEQPLSGMSMNPARTFASALFGDNWTGWWVYFTAPPLGMLAAAQTYLWQHGRSAVHCAKLHHQNTKRCIFCVYRAEKRARSERSFSEDRVTGPADPHPRPQQARLPAR